MIEPLTYFLAVVTSLPLAAFVPFRFRPLFLAALGTIVFAMLVPSAGLFLLVVILEALLICYLVKGLERSSPWRKYLPYLLLLNMFWVDFHHLLVGRYLETLGVSFALIRIFMTAKHLVSSRKDLSKEFIEWLFVSAFYLPAIMVGPIFSGVDLRKQIKKPEIRLGSTSYLYRNLIFGFVLTALVNPMFVGWANDLKGFDQVFMPAFMILLFLQLFAAFWGQSLIAEMGSRILGLSIPANFNKPWVATNIKEFWQRWHISMAGFIMQFIYLPLTLNGINAKIATIAAFVFMGLWHEVAPGYMIWGIAHGIFMVYWPKTLNDATRLKRILGNILTIVIVIILSYIANYAFEDGFNLAEIR